jgi:recombination protein RecT
VNTEHLIKEPAGRQLGWSCQCGKKFANKSLADRHLLEASGLTEVEDIVAAGQTGFAKVTGNPDTTNEVKEEETVAEVEQPEAVETPVESEVVETPPTEEKPKAKTAVAKVEKTLAPVQQVQRDVARFAEKLLGEKRATEFATRVALISRESPKLAEAIRKNPDSFVAAYMASVTLDLMPNTPEQDAFVIPYGDKVQFQTGYRGLLKLARRSGEILTISAELVFAGDEFDVQFGTERKITHKPDLNVNRTDYSKVTHAYAAAKLTNGETQFAVMTREELDKVQRSAKAQSTDSPWRTWPERMALKTVLKRLAQLLPTATDDDLRRAVAYDSLSEAGKLRFKEGEIIEGEVVEVSQATLDAIGQAQSKDEVEEILHGLPIEERKKAAGSASRRIKELA